MGFQLTKTLYLFSFIWISFDVFLCDNLLEKYYDGVFSYLQTYNDIFLDNILVLNFMKEDENKDYLFFSCTNLVDLTKDKSIWLQYFQISSELRNVVSLTKLLRSKRNSLIILCNADFSLTKLNLLQDIR